MMKNWKFKLVVPAFVFAACIILGGAQVARATDICSGQGDWEGQCKNGSLPNGVCQLGEVCDDGNTVDGDGCDTNCSITGCGNGLITAGEECDDGTSNDDDPVDAGGDACDTQCRSKVCGNGRVEGGETCDDGNAFNNDGCDSEPGTCAVQLGGGGTGICCQDDECVNGITNNNEECDDGNTVDDDTCGNDCVSNFCGDGTPDAGLGEECDDGNTDNLDACNNDCTDSECGDSQIDTGIGENCDDGNTVSNDGCSATCVSEFCGDGISQAGEACDDGNTVDDDTCLGDCSKDPVCGDGVTDANECCDDGACVCDAPKKAADGRSCATQLGRDACTADGGVCEDPSGTPCTIAAGGGNFDDIADACRSACACPECGDGITDSGEVCDDGFVGTAPSAADDTDACPNGTDFFATGMECSMLNTCGDGVPNSDASGGNTCDNGEGTNPKTCSGSGTPCSLDSDCGANEVCGNDDGTDGTCHTTGFTDADCPNGGAAGACACHPHYCGDGATDTGEGCDDGNTVSADASGCQANCALATCGDGTTDTGEACDAGAQNGMDGNNTNGAVNGGADCTTTCTANVCGDGEALDGEPCDDGNAVNTDDCLNTCVGGVCGDGVTRSTGAEPVEQCDDGQNPPADQEEFGGTDDGCSARCCFEPTVALGTTAQRLAQQACNLDHLAIEISDLSASRAKSRLTRHITKALKLQAQAEAGVAAGSSSKACSAEKRKDRLTVCMTRTLGLGLVRGEITAAQHREISQKVINVHGWVQNIRSGIGCL